MEITSEVPPKTLDVIDLDIRFLGETREITLFPGDTETEETNPNRIHIHLAGQKLMEGISTPVEDVVIYMDHVLWIRRHTRTITLPKDETDGPAHRASTE